VLDDSLGDAGADLRPIGQQLLVGEPPVLGQGPEDADGGVDPLPASPGAGAALPDLCSEVLERRDDTDSM
jgi:hypothetical protein